MTQKLEPLKVSCTSADCNGNLHCFRKSREMSENDRGKCRYCHADLIDWRRVQSRNLEDVRFTFRSLRMEMIRHHFWHREIDEKAFNHALRKGKAALTSLIRKRVVGSVAGVQPFRDGYQTPYEGNIVYYAQHAIAACCRKCIEYWHGIPQGRALIAGEVNYLVALIELFIQERMPDLPEEPTHVPRARRR